MDDLCWSISCAISSLFSFSPDTAIRPGISLSSVPNFLHRCIPQVNFSLQQGKGFSSERPGAAV